MRRRHSPAEVNLLTRRRAFRDARLPELAGRPVSRKRHPLDCGNSGCYLCRPGPGKPRVATKVTILEAIE